MANQEVNEIEKTYNDPNASIRMGSYLIRRSQWEDLIHRQDDLKNVGYDWRPNLLKKSLSTYLQSNDDVSEMIERYRQLLVFIVDKIQDVKKAFNYTVDKHYKYIS